MLMLKNEKSFIFQKKIETYNLISDSNNKVKRRSRGMKLQTSFSNIKDLKNTKSVHHVVSGAT